MDREQLFRNLNELEVQLRGIKSATEQVNAVVKADRELAVTINAYAKNVNDQVSLRKGLFEGSLDETTKVYKDALAETKSSFDETLTAALDEYKAKVKNIDSSNATLTDLSTDKLPSVVKNLKSLVDDSLTPLVADVKKTCRSLPDISEISKSESDRVISNLGGKMESVITDLESLSQSVEDLKSSIQQDIEVSQQAAEDTLKAIEKLDGLPDYIKQTLSATKQTLSAKLEGNSKSLKNLSASIKAINQQMAQQNAKFEEVMKMNKVLICMVAISMLLTAILKFI